MISLNLQSELTSLFEQGQFQQVLDRAQEEEISPAGDPKTANLVAAALFRLGRYPDCLLWCEALTPSLEGDATFASMHGALLRRLGRLDDAESVFRAALNNTPSNPFLRNNFANLLIDQQAFEEAEKILEALLKENPNYEDAQINLNRLNFQKNLAESAPKDSSSKTSTAKTDNEISDRFIDPLAAAFSDEEVAMAGGVAAKQKGILPVGGLQPSDLPDRERDKELHETLSLARQTIDADPQQAIRDCNLLHEKLGIQAPIYEVAGEAFIRLQLFGDAETCLLTAHGLGSMEGAVVLNLANLAAMRGDQRLALHWLELLAQRQPDHPQLEKVRETLFPNGAPKTSTNPFQVNLDQRTPGQFV